MEEYQERVLEEQRELSEKIVKLIRFTTTGTYRELPIEERQLLTSQLHAMTHYNDVLTQRIANFAPEASNDGG